MKLLATVAVPVVLLSFWLGQHQAKPALVLPAPPVPAFQAGLDALRQPTPYPRRVEQLIGLEGRKAQEERL